MKSPRHIARRTMTVERWLRLDRAGKIAVWSGMTALVVFTIVRHATDDGAVWLRRERLEVSVVSVLDACAVRLALPDDPSRTVEARLWGVAVAPEYLRSAQAVLAEAAGRVATVAFDPHHRMDRDGRLVVYLYNATGEMVNEVWLHEGWARAVDEPHYLRDWFFKKQGQVQRRRVGIWRDAGGR